MKHKRIWWLASGALAGVLTTRIAARAEGRRLLKALLRRAFTVKDTVESELALLREDLSDLVAEAREEHQQASETAHPEHTPKP